jgi:hypothetical protein
MKNVFCRIHITSLLLILILSCLVANAQSVVTSDTIVLRSEVKLEAILRGIQQHTVTYNKPNSPDGPILTLHRSDIAQIKYGNGEITVFEEKKQTYFKFNKPKTDTAATKYKDGTFYNLPIKTVHHSNTEQLQNNYPFYLKKAERFHKMGIAGVVCGVTGTVLGIGLMTTGNNASGIDGIMQAMLGVAFFSSGLGVGIPFTLTGYLREKTYKKRAMLVQEELRKRNLLLGYQLAPAINPSTQLAGLALKMTF